MSDDKQKIKATYPLPAYNYRVTISELGNAVVMGFSEVSGLSIEYQPVIYRHGMSFIMGAKIIPGMRQPIHFTLKKGVIKGGEALNRWMTSAYSGDLLSGKRDVLIDLCDETGSPVIRWKVLKALPVKLSAPTFNASTNEVAIESLELMTEDIVVDYNP